MNLGAVEMVIIVGVLALVGMLIWGMTGKDRKPD